MKRIAVLGSTGSIGKNTLEVIAGFPKDFSVCALSTNADIGSLEKQAKIFKPRYLCVSDEGAFRRFKARHNTKAAALSAKDGLLSICAKPDVDMVVLAISGIAALAPLLAAIENGKDVAMANKEALVAAGPIVMRRARARGVKLIPIDSEQSAIWQCLEGEERRNIRNIYLTASGGPFLRRGMSRLKDISVSGVLKHPRWKMGRKISVDSATLMNKGLEVLEAMFLFDVGVDKIKVLIHPQAIIHSMVEFIDGAVMAQLSATDMRIPIQYALSYPERMPCRLEKIDFYKVKELGFEKPDSAKFPCLSLAYEAARRQGTLPCVLNAANEVSVQAFLGGGLKFLDIPRVVEKVMARHRNQVNPNLKDILQADSWARVCAGKLIGKLN